MELVIAGLFALCAYLAYDQFADIGATHTASRIWADGVPAVGGSVHGHRTSKFGMTWLVASYDLDVSYEDAAGNHHDGNHSFWTMIGGPDTDDQPELRYDREHPDKFAVSWEIAASGARLRATIILGLVCTALALVMGLVISLVPKAMLRIWRCGRRGDELVVRVTGFDEHREKSTVRRTYRFAYAGADRAERFASETYTLPHIPLFTDADQTHALALLYGETAQVLRDDGYPFAITNREWIDLNR